VSRARALALTGALAILAGAAVWVSSRKSAAPRPLPAPAPSATDARGTAIAFEEARARLAGFRSYRALFDRHLVRGAHVQADGAVRIDVDVRGLAHAALLRAGWTDLEDALPSGATATVAALPGRVVESFVFACPGGCVLDLFARLPGSPARAPFPLPGTPLAVAEFSLDRERLADLDIGGGSRRALDQRASVLEQILGRPVRAPLAEDLVGSGRAAFYQDGPAGSGRTLLALELRRSDRVQSLVDLLLGLAALTRGATIERHAGVPVGAWSSGATGLAIAVDGPFLLVASARSPVEDAIDLRRGAPPSPDAVAAEARNREASFTLDGGPSCRARLTHDGDNWRLDASGDRPLAESDVVAGWLRSVRARTQRAEG
jgi:hypothetical protein